MKRVSDSLAISVVIPVRYCDTKFEMCLMSIIRTQPAPEEIIVVVDGGPPESCSMTGSHGIKTLVTSRSRPCGPACARNLGAKSAKGDIILFIDSDVTVQPGIIARIRETFAVNPDLAALFGSYDDDPFERNFFSQYRNLLHHYVHQISSENASTFWGACGAVRRDIFNDIGGFDENYRVPSIEDIELGYRLKKAGYRVRLLKTLRVKHLKHWSFRDMLKTDFFCRALPWTGLILREGEIMNDLNLKRTDRVSALFVFLLPLAFFEAGFLPWLVLPAVALLLCLIGVNLDLYRFFWRKRGGLFSLKSIPCHWLYYFYSGIAFMTSSVGYRLENLIHGSQRP